PLKTGAPFEGAGRGLAVAMAGPKASEQPTMRAPEGRRRPPKAAVRRATRSCRSWSTRMQIAAGARRNGHRRRPRRGSPKPQELRTRRFVFESNSDPPVVEQPLEDREQRREEHEVDPRFTAKPERQPLDLARLRITEFDLLHG